MRKGMIAVLVCVILCVMGYSGYRLLNIYKEYQVGTDYYGETTEDFVSYEEGQMPEQVDESGENTDVVEEPYMPAPIEVDFVALQGENPDVVGWIYCEDSQINYPILRGEDNDKYLHRMMNGKSYSGGSIFMDYRCEGDFSSANTIIYGHHMKNGSMFGSLQKYKKQEYYDAHSIVWILTPEKNYKVKLIGGLTIDAGDMIYDVVNEAEYLPEILASVEKKSTFTVDNPELWNANRIFTLSTCAYDFEDARYILVGVPVWE